MRLELTLGSPTRVDVTAQENLLGISTTTVSGGMLTVDTTRNYISKDGITVTVTMPTLAELRLAGGAVGHGTAIDVDTLAVRTDGGAFLNMAGSVSTLSVHAAGGGVIDFSAFTARDERSTSRAVSSRSWS